MDTKPMNTCRVLSESKRILLANYTHFVTLSLFFLPLSFLSITNQLFTINQKPGIHHVFYMLLANIPALCSAGTIAYSTHHAFFGEPLTLSSSIKSLTSTFFPLFWTSIVSSVLLSLIMLTFLIFVGVIFMLLQSVGFVVIDYDNLNFFTWFPLVVVGVVLIVIVLYFQVSWSLASVVVVVESKWGFAALKRSSYLVKGMRSVSLLIQLYFGICSGLMAWICSANAFNISGDPFIFLIVLGSIIMMMIFLRIIAANTVLYNFCKVLHDELPIQVSQGFSDHKPYDYEKVSPHDVTVSVA